MLCLFFFCKQKTAYGMRISDWSSDVCSSDLASRSGASSRWRFDRPHRDGRVRDTKSGTVGWVEPTAKPIVFPAGRAMGFASLYPSYGLGVTRAGWDSPTGSTSSDQRRSEKHRVGKECASQVKSRG